MITITLKYGILPVDMIMRSHRTAVILYVNGVQGHKCWDHLLQCITVMYKSILLLVIALF